MNFKVFKKLVVLLFFSLAFSLSLSSQCKNDVGTIKGIKVFYGQSTRHDLSDTIFLCWKDRFLLEHNNNFDLQSDPDPITPGGIGYCWYSDKPTRYGNTEAEIKLDKDFKLWTDPQNLVISAGELNGDIEFENGYFAGSKSFNEFVNTVGSPATLMYYAPITYDVKKGDRGYFENGGKCVKVGADQSFPVVYLNPITISDIIYNVDGDTLKVSFIVKGGTSEFYKSQGKTVNYSYIEVYDADYRDNEKGVVLTQIFSHGDRVTVKLPYYGNFVVHVEDAYSCNDDNRLVASKGGVNTVMKLDTVHGMVGDTVCTMLSARNFEKVNSILGRVQYNPNGLDFIGYFPQNQNIFNLNLVPSLNVPGTFGLYGEITPPVTFIQEKDIVPICFGLIGEPGECYPVLLSRFDLSLEPTGDTYPLLESGLVCIDPPNGLYVSAKYCGTETNDPIASITFKVYNGVGPYTYKVKDGATTVESGSIPAALTGEPFTVYGLYSNKTYSIEVTDANGEVYTQDVLISKTNPVEFEDFTITPPHCFGWDDGQISFTVKGGQFAPNHTIEWSNGVYNQDTLKDLKNGYYGVTLTTGTGCKTDTFVYLNTERLSAEIAVLDSSNCVGDINGRIRVDVKGDIVDPVDGYTIKVQSENNLYVKNTFGSAIFDKLSGGKINVLVQSDAKNYPGCKEEYELEIPTRYQMEISNTATDVQCNGERDGKVTFNVDLKGFDKDNFKVDYTYFPFPTATKLDANTILFENMGATTQIFTFTDSITGCSIMDTIDLDEPDPIQWSSIEKTSAQCLQDGSAYAIINITSGGVLPFTLSGIGNDFIINAYGTKHRFENLKPGDYNIVVTDANGCEKNIFFTIDVASGALKIDTIKYDLLCNAGSTTDIVVEASNSTGGIKYKWTKNGTDIGDNSNTLSNVGAGLYVVEVSDNACTVTDTIELIAGKAFDYTFNSDDAECAEGETGGFLGNACVNVDIDDTGFEYKWSNGENTKCISGVGAGTYVVTISYGNGCETIGSVEVNGAPPIQTKLLDLQGISCNDGLHSDGKVIIEASGGNNSTGVYRFMFDSGSKTGSIVTVDNLAGGKNYYTVTYNTINGNSCTKKDSFEIGIPDKLAIDKVQLFTPTCFGDCDGSAIIKAKGGNNVAYFYKWQETAELGAVGTGLCAGTYHIEVKDANGCAVIDSITMIEPDELVVEIDSFNTKDVNCSGEDSGQIKVKFSGGNTDGQYTFKWNPDVSSTNLASDLPKGLYTVTVTDHKGCQATTSYELKGQAILRFIAKQKDTIKCFGDKTCIYLDTVYGGAGPAYSFSLNGGSVYPYGSCIEVVGSKEPYLVTVFDSEGCKEEDDILISQPDEIFVDLGNDIEIDLGDSKTVSINTNTNISNVKWIIDTLSINYEYLNDLHTELKINAFKDSKMVATVISTDGCEATGEVNVLVNTFRNVYVPNIFTPDGDGLNEEFKITIGKGVKKVNYFKIFDRWGNLMHEENNLLPVSGNVGAWDGTYRGRKVNPGVYVYLIEVEFMDDRVILYRGAVTVVR